MDNLMKARCRLMIRVPWYGHIAMNMVWKPSEMDWMEEAKRTMGVRITRSGEIECLYYPKFVAERSVDELFGIVQHEIEHIVRCHCIRRDDRLPEPWNIAADMAVNGRKSSPRIGYRSVSNNEIVLPLNGNCVWIPDGWNVNDSSEQYYAKLMEDHKAVAGSCDSCGRAVSEPQDDGGSGSGGSGLGNQSQNDSSGQGGSGDQGGSGGQGDSNGACSKCGSKSNGKYSFAGVSGKMIDNHDIWNTTEVSHDIARQIIKSHVDSATRSQGSAPGHLTEAIQELAKPVIKWQHFLRQYIGRHVGSSRKTYSRRNRRHSTFGIKGVSHHAASTVNVIVDTSGSISSDVLSQFFGEIDMISSRAKVNVLQWDYSFQGYDKYRRGDWKKFKIHGRGGTDMAAPIEWLVDNRKVADVQIMLTDGHCNYADDKKFPMITVVTEDGGSKPSWGHVVDMRI